MPYIRPSLLLAVDPPGMLTAELTRLVTTAADAADSLEAPEPRRFASSLPPGLAPRPAGARAADAERLSVVQSSR